MKLRNTIIYLIGIPAVGKYTTAKTIAQMTGAKVVDNQLINNPIFAMLDGDGRGRLKVPKEAWAHIARIRKVVLKYIREYVSPNTSLIFTNVLQNAKGDRRLFREIEKLAESRGCIFVPVWLSCSEKAIRDRKNNADRHERMKDTNVSDLRYWYEEFDELRIDHPNSVSLDTSNSKPAQTAETILKHIAKLKRSRSSRKK